MFDNTAASLLWAYHKVKQTSSREDEKMMEINFESDGYGTRAAKAWYCLLNFLSQKLPAIVEQIFFQRKSDCCLSYTLLLVITEKINHFHYFQLLKILGFTCCKYYANSILLNRASKNLLCKLYMSYGYTLDSFQLLLNTKIENIRVAEDSFSVYNS